MLVVAAERRTKRTSVSKEQRVVKIAVICSVSTGSGGRSGAVKE